MRAVELLEKMEGIQDNNLLMNLEDEKRFLKMFNILQKVRPDFKSMHGLAKTAPEYFQATKIYNNLLRKVLDYDSSFRKKIPDMYIYF